MKAKTKIKRRLLTLALVLAMILTSVLPSAALTTGVTFSDVPKDAWYVGYIEKCAWLEIINGYSDGSYQPAGTLKRSEFIKMLAIAAELYTLNNSTAVHWAAPYWNMLKEAGVLEDMNIPCSRDALEKPITRYEMAVLIRNVLYNVYCENTMELTNPAANISDYNSIDMAYRGSVEQAYGKGILTGYSDSSFQGGRNLSRAEAAAVICRLLWAGERKQVSFAKEKVPTAVASESFAFRYRSMSTAERRLALFGNENKTYFTSAADAGSHVVGVQVRTWDLKSDGVTKYTRTWTIYVNTVVVEEVKAIFEEIYNNPEKFPIHSLGGARYSDTMRHSWGCAIDINPVENYYVNYSTGAVVGSFCYKNGSSPYCITPGGSVVQAFAKYGWGWGGQGWTSAVDYMHFSILSSGG
jgi:hypothetical protein